MIESQFGATMNLIDRSNRGRHKLFSSYRTNWPGGQPSGTILLFEDQLTAYKECHHAALNSMGLNEFTQRLQLDG